MIVNRHIKMVNGDLNEVCQAIQEAFGLSAAELLEYCKQAPHADRVGDSVWPIGSVFPNEHRLLYGLVRYLKPTFAIEAGCYCGCSTTAILSAMRANRTGELMSLDIIADMGNRVPSELRAQWNPVIYDAAKFLVGLTPPSFVNFFFEDTEHTRESTHSITQAALPHMAENSLMLWHDPISRPDVIDGLADCGIIPEIYLLEGSNCGVAVWQKP